MTQGFAVPDWTGVGASLLLVALAAVIAYRQQLHLARELVIAAARAGVQLVAVGAILLILFRHTGLPGALGWVVLMILIAGQVAGCRGAGLPHAVRSATIGVAFGSSITLGSLLVLGIISTQARVVVPVGGMIVSAAMQSTGIALRRLVEDARRGRDAVEALLALGLSAHRSFLPSQRSALRTAMIPSIDSTKVVGLITLPGAMTGLILAGVDPLTAIRYQIVVMYMLLAATTLAALAATRVAERTLFDGAQRLVALPD
ncbi:ABC transporter permease [Nocardia seriolae]|uniref:ABC transporter permease n=1 Tax=Nocardia seriolae TaxID=37332 RepID=UPI00090B2AB7|nr:iron export ABC transporter permease subunit FetB [Nocardia seriolae]MTJ63736.1 iron export ABC transporter permease subunit FetB [Nocardia seriolae]MTJ75541.1 iron export ABC transporter permease subunit FetB [Nocardia seriolae]MTJ88303.1 iron export ABC transporter permease subunit FetB [Nocardia seriolae]MTK32289.1 iron export ABC transporter permease subunit FetB [Nocardia seriolae]MTK41626.1 iron export ABC transporter permease subunit FetB [Nocardia seriolae]